MDERTNLVEHRRHVFNIVDVELRRWDPEFVLKFANRSSLHAHTVFQFVLEEQRVAECMKTRTVSEESSWNAMRNTSTVLLYRRT